jgi:hypothetical protein
VKNMKSADILRIIISMPHLSLSYILNSNFVSNDCKGLSCEASRSKSPSFYGTRRSTTVFTTAN